jgi:hypothetical protein
MGEQKSVKNEQKMGKTEQKIEQPNKKWGLEKQTKIQKKIFFSVKRKTKKNVFLFVSFFHTILEKAVKKQICENRRKNVKKLRKPKKTK